MTVYVPGLTSLAPVDRDESRFAQASRQMLESIALPPERQERGMVATWDGAEAPGMHSGGLAIPMVHRRIRLNKPPLIYWLQAASAGVLSWGQPLRDAIWMYRLPSVLAGIATVLLTWRIGRRMFDPRAAWLGAAMIAVAPVFVWEAHQARADMVLVTITTAAMGAVWMIWRRASGGRERSRAGWSPWPTSWGWPIALWILIGLGILAKGPVTPMVAGLCALALSATTRRWRWLGATRPFIGLAIVVAMVAPWAWAVADRIGWDRYIEIILDETLGRSASPKEGHLGPPGYHALFAIVLLWPGSMLVALALPRAWRRARPKEPRAQARGESAPGESKASSPSLCSGLLRPFTGRPAELFCLCWIIPPWVVFELVLTKLPHYTMPMYPALALLCARAVYAAETRRLLGLTLGAIRRALAVFGAFSIAIALGVGAAGLVAAPRAQGALAGAITLAAILLIVAAICATRRGRFVSAQLTLLGAAAALWIALVGLVLPAADHLWVSERLVRQLPAHPPPVAAVAYHEDSLVYRLRGRLARIDPAQIDAWLGAHERSILIVPADPPLDVPGLEPLGAATGFNYARGRRVDLIILRQGAP
jgi:4-amino-4-deoxy-L-arabinose transferase-like glycosyltransferase